MSLIVLRIRFVVSVRIQVGHDAKALNTLTSFCFVGVRICFSSLLFRLKRLAALAACISSLLCVSSNVHTLHGFHYKASATLTACMQFLLRVGLQVYFQGAFLTKAFEACIGCMRIVSHLLSSKVQCFLKW